MRERESAMTDEFGPFRLFSFHFGPEGRAFRLIEATFHRKLVFHLGANQPAGEEPELDISR